LIKKPEEKHTVKTKAAVVVKSGGKTDVWAREYGGFGQEWKKQKNK